jgi:vacuolar-type H+-ATPase subunit E/Vma4
LSRLIRRADSAESLINTPAGKSKETNQNVDNTNKTDNKDTQQNNGDNKIAIDLLERINNSVDDIRDTYYSLLDNLNAVNESYPNLYNELKQLVKLPDEVEVREIVEMQEDVKNAVKYLQDPNFLDGIIKK